MWIEITEYGGGYRGTNVTPYAGVWIEIRYLTTIGLPINVTPYAGVWIEILCYELKR